MKQQDQLPAAAPEIEESVLGAILLYSEAWALSFKHLTPSHFSVPKYAFIFKAMEALFNESRPIDILTVIDKVRLLNFNTLTAYDISILTNSVFSAAHISEWINILNYKKFIRDCAMYANRIQTAISTGDPEQVEAAVNEGVHAPTNGSIITATDAMFAALKEYDELCETKSANAYGTRPEMKAMADLVGLWQQGALVIVGGRPGMGKTAFTKLLTTDFVKKNKKVLFYSLEMSKTELAHRYVHELVNMSKAQLARTILAQDISDYAATTQTDISTAWGKMFKPNGQDLLFISDAVDVTVESIRADVALLKAQHPDLQAVIIDYLQLINPSVTNRNYSREQEISHISRKLKKLAKEFSVTVFCLSQLNRGVENRADKKPNLADLRDSGAIEQDADMVLFLYRADYSSYNLTEIECNGEISSAAGKLCIINAKNRHGSTGEELFGFNGELTKVYELATPQPAPQLINEPAPF